MDKDIIGALAPFLVSVKERLPRLHTPVLATVDGKEWVVARVYSKEDWKKEYVGWAIANADCVDTSFNLAEITHWMPLPNHKEFKKEIDF